MSREAKKLGHENVDFGQYGENGYAHYIVHEDEETLYFGICSSVSAGVGVQFFARLPPADVDKLIDLLQRGKAVLQADIDRRTDESRREVARAATEVR